MKFMKKIIFISFTFLALMACNNSKKQNKKSGTKTIEISEEEQAYKTAIDAYIWAYPMVSIGVTCAMATDVPKPLPNAFAPINTFGSVAKLFTSADKDVVSSNVDTQYSSAFLDLTQGAVEISVPATNGRYYSMMLMDAYSNVFDYIGSRTTGTDAGKYLIVGPDWNGETPADVLKVFKAPTNLVWVIGRTLVDGQDDVANVRKIQAQYIAKVIPPATASPSSWRDRNNFPAIDKTKPPVVNVNTMDWKTYFTWVGKLMMENPVPESQQSYVDNFKSIGLSFENGFEPSKLSSEQQKGLERAVAEALKQIKAASKKKTGTIHEGWFYSLKAGVWGDDYMYRAAIAYRSLGQNIPEEAVYMNTTEDKDGNLLDAAKNNYQITFAKGQLPPVNAFWSMTMYTDKNFFVPNSKRLAIGNRTKSMKPNKDGSLTIYFQKEAPKGNEGNWLPAPDGNFRVSLRLYVPKENVIDGSWLPPGIEIIK